MVRIRHPGTPPPPARSGRRGAFTLVELLVVVAILLLLIALLFPQLAAGRERARRIQCLSNVRWLLHATTVMADDRGGALPVLHSGNSPYWFSVTARNTMITNYGLARKTAYCPSNPYWNWDDFWTWPGGNDSVWGYPYLGNDGKMRWSYVEPVVSPPTFAKRLTDNPQEKVLWVDLNRYWPGYEWGRPDNRSRGANHMNLTRYNPEGGNEGFLDGHAQWVPFKDMREKMRGSQSIYW